MALDGSLRQSEPSLSISSSTKTGLIDPARYFLDLAWHGADVGAAMPFDLGFNASPQG